MINETQLTRMNTNEEWENRTKGHDENENKLQVHDHETKQNRLVTIYKLNLFS